VPPREPCVATAVFHPPRRAWSRGGSGRPQKTSVVSIKRRTHLTDPPIHLELRSLARPPVIPNDNVAAAYIGLDPRARSPHGGPRENARPRSGDGRECHRSKAPSERNLRPASGVSFSWLTCRSASSRRARRSPAKGPPRRASARLMKPSDHGRSDDFPSPIHDSYRDCGFDCGDCRRLRGKPPSNCACIRQQQPASRDAESGAVGMSAFRRLVHRAQRDANH